MVAGCRADSRECILHIYTHLQVYNVPHDSRVDFLHIYMYAVLILVVLVCAHTMVRDSDIPGPSYENKKRYPVIRISRITGIVGYSVFLLPSKSRLLSPHNRIRDNCSRSKHIQMRYRLSD